MRPSSATTKRPQSATPLGNSRPSNKGPSYNSSSSGPASALVSLLHSSAAPQPHANKPTPHHVGASALSTVGPSSHNHPVHTTGYHHPQQLPAEVIEKLSAIGCGAVVVAAVAVRRFNASPNTLVEYVATLTAGARTVTTEPMKAVHDFVSGGWTLTFRDVHAIFPIDAQYDGRLGIVVSVHSTCATLHFGSATCRSPREWCALSRPRGEVQVSFHEVYPHHVSTGAPPVQGSLGGIPPPPPSSVRMTPLIARPNTASVLGRAPLPSNSGGASAGGGRTGTMQHAQPPPPPQGATPPSPHRQWNSGTDSMPVTRAPPRTVTMADWAIDDLPPPSPSGFGGAVYLVVRFAHSEHRLPPALVCTRKYPGRDPELDTLRVVAAQRPETVLSKARAAGLTSSDDDDDDGDGGDETDGVGHNHSSSNMGPREARWPNKSIAFDIPLLLQEPVAVISVYLCDFRNPEGGRLLAEATCPVDISSPTAVTRVARRVVFTGEVRLTAMFTVQVECHEARREGAGGRPTSAFPRRAPTGLSPSSSGNFQSPPGGGDASSSSPLLSLSGRPQRMSPINEAQRQQPYDIGGGGGGGPSSGQRRATSNNRQAPAAASASHDGSLDAEELPADDFVRDDDDDDDDDDAVAIDRTQSTMDRCSNGQHHNGNGSMGRHTASPRDAACYADVVPPEALDALAAAFQVRLRQVLTASFQVVVDRMESLERRVGAVEERVQHQLALESTGGGGDQRIHTPPPPMGVYTQCAGGSNAGGRGGHHVSTSAASTTHATAMASGGSTSLSRPNSGESYRGAGLYDRGSFPEHANPLYSDALLRQKFATYDSEGSGYLTRAQLVHFYRTHNSFSVDETNDDVEEELRRFAPRLDEDAVTFDEFSLVALRLAKF